MYETIKAIKWPALLIAAYTGIYLIVLDYYVPLFSDDLMRAKHDFDFIRSLKLAYSEYFGWSGRLPVMILNHSFFTGDIPVMIFNIMNGVILFLFLLYMTATSNINSKYVQAVYLLTFIGLFWFMPTTLGEVLFWKTGAIQYFWGGVLAILAITPMLRWFWCDKYINTNKITTTAYVIICFIGGFWLEHVSAALAVSMVILLLISKYVYHRKIPLSIKLGFTSWVMGTAFLIAAPGNYERTGLTANPMPLIEKILKITELMPSHTYPVLLYLAIFFLLLMILYPNQDIKKQIGLSMSYMAIGLLCAYALVGAPVIVFHGRGAFHTELFFILSVMALFPIHIFTNDSTKMLPLFVAVISVVFGVMVIKDGRHILHVYKDVSKQETNRHDMIAEAKRNGKTEIVLPPLFLTDRINTKMRINFGRYFARDITRKPSMENNVYAKYHGMKKVSRE